MKRLFEILLCAGFISVLVSFTFPTKKKSVYVFNYENVLGTSCEIKIDAKTPELANKAEQAALQEVDRLNAILSGYDSSSEFSHWSRTLNIPVPISQDLFQVLGQFDKWNKKTKGAINASAELGNKIWKLAAKNNREPSQEELRNAVRLMVKPHWKLDSNAKTATRLDEVPIRLNSFTKSYIIEKASEEAAKVIGVSGVLVNIGGDMVIRGSHTENILISNPKADAENDDPIDEIRVQGKAVATSGNYRRGEWVNGIWHSHILDPRTAIPSDDIISATVISKDPVLAGVLATAFNVLNPEESQVLAAEFPDLDYFIRNKEGKVWKSEGWNRNQIPFTPNMNSKPHALIPGGKEWDAKYELVLNLELAEIEGIRVHRPFVAVWVVDKDKKPVRSIALWYNKPKYLDDMHAWYDAYYSRFTAGNNSVSSTTSATRSPGKYKIKWDGKDDQGQLVKLGTYTLMVEVAREHGTYQLMNHSFDFTKKVEPFQFSPNTEVSSASVEYLKKGNEE